MVDSFDLWMMDLLLTCTGQDAFTLVTKTVRLNQTAPMTAVRIDERLLPAAIAQVQHLAQQRGEQQEHVGDHEHPIPLQHAIDDEAGRSGQLPGEQPVRDALRGAAAPGRRIRTPLRESADPTKGACGIAAWTALA